MSFVAGAALKKELRLLLHGRRVDLAVAYWGKGACDLLGLANAFEGSRIACDAFGGACNPEAIQDLLSRGFAVRDVPGLHSKVYLTHDGMVVGSANASSNGLGREGVELNPELEASIITSDRRQIESATRWFDRIYLAGIEVTLRDLPAIRSAWLRNRDARPITAGKGERLKDLLLDERRLDYFKDRRFFVTINKPATPSNENLNELRARGLSRDHYWDYPELGSVVEVGDTILSFEIGLEDVEKGCLWKVQSVIDGGRLIPVQKMRSYLGLNHTRADGELLHRQLMQRLSDGTVCTNPEPLSVHDFAKTVSR